MAPDEATRAIARRYLAAYGPATDRDFHRWWGGASLATIRKWIADLGDDTPFAPTIPATSSIGQALLHDYEVVRQRLACPATLAP